VILKCDKIDIKKHVWSAFNGNQALDLVKERSVDDMFHVIFMDCNMPFKDGCTASAEIRDYINGRRSADPAWKQPLIVAVTGHTEEQYIENTLSCGMNMMIQKPATYKKIKSVLNEARLFFFDPNYDGDMF